MGLNFRVFCMNFDFVIYKKVWKRERKKNKNRKIFNFGFVYDIKGMWFYSMLGV